MGLCDSKCLNYIDDNLIWKTPLPMRKEQRHKITTESGSTFIKHKVDKPTGRSKFYTPLTINPKDRLKLTLRQQEMIKAGALFPIRYKEFKEILDRLNTTIKYKTKI